MIRIKWLMLPQQILLVCKNSFHNCTCSKENVDGVQSELFNYSSQLDMYSLVLVRNLTCIVNRGVTDMGSRNDNIKSNCEKLWKNYG